MIYISIFFILLLSTYIKDKEIKALATFFLPLLLIFIAAFRDLSVGTDTRNGYLELYNYIEDGLNVSYIEKGWYIINKICIELHLGYQGVICVSFLLCFLPVWKVIKIEKIDKLEGLFIYYAMYLYMHAFNLIRQCIAMSFCLLAFSLFYRKKYWRFILSMLIAFYFHKSALLFLVFIPIIKMNLNTLKVCCICVLSLVIGLVMSENMFIKIAGPYAGYLRGSSFGFRPHSVKILLFTIALNFVFCFFIILGGKRIIQTPWFLLLLLGYVVLDTTMTLSLGTRIMFYFTQAQIIYYPKYFDIKKKDKNILKFIFYLYLFINFMRILLGQWSEIVPYKLGFNGIC